AGVSVGSVRKLEQGGQVRMDTLHKLARALNVVTVTFAAPTSPEPSEASPDEMVLADIRSAISPPIGVDGQPILGVAAAFEPDLRELGRTVNLVAAAYHADRYDDLASVVPAVLRSAHFHVTAFDSGREHEEALRLRADITGMAGRYLVQIRAHDLALT